MLVYIVGGLQARTSEASRYHSRPFKAAVQIGQASGLGHFLAAHDFRLRHQALFL